MSLGRPEPLRQPVPVASPPSDTPDDEPAGRRGNHRHRHHERPRRDGRRADWCRSTQTAITAAGTTWSSGSTHQATSTSATSGCGTWPPSCSAPTAGRHRAGPRGAHFELETTDGRRLHLRDLRGRPVLLHFVSYTCPVTRGAASSMRELHRRYGDRVQFVDVVVRQAHPGERRGPYRSYAEKLDDARRTDKRRPSSGPWLSTISTAPSNGPMAAWPHRSACSTLEGAVSFDAMWGVAPALTTRDRRSARGAASALQSARESTVCRTSAPPSSRGKAVPLAVASSRWSTSNSASPVHCSS